MEKSVKEESCSEYVKTKHFKNQSNLFSQKIEMLKMWEAPTDEIIYLKVLSLCPAVWNEYNALKCEFALFVISE